MKYVKPDLIERTIARCKETKAGEARLSTGTVEGFEISLRLNTEDGERKIVVEATHPENGLKVKETYNMDKWQENVIQKCFDYHSRKYRLRDEGKLLGVRKCDEQSYLSLSREPYNIRLMRSRAATKAKRPKQKTVFSLSVKKGRWPWF